MGAMRHEKTTYTHAPDLHGMELLHAQYITHRFQPHVHDGYAIGVIERGAESFYYRGDPNVVAPVGCIVIVNPHEIHTGEAVTDDGWRYRMFYPSVTFMRLLAHELTGDRWDTPHFPEPIIYDDGLRSRLVTLHRVIQDSPDTLERQSLAREVFGALLVRYASNRANPLQLGDERAVVRRVRDLIEDRLTENVSLDELAAHAAMSPYHLLRLFRAATGMTPHVYRTQQRLIRAKALLAAGTPIAEVAAQTGFTDQSHLTRRFKQAYGIPPGEYARQV
jgi:AraC-like DNA-binding protein